MLLVCLTLDPNRLHAQHFVSRSLNGFCNFIGYISFFQYNLIILFSIILIMSLQLSHFLLLFPPLFGIPLPSSNPPSQFMPMDHAYKFFGSSFPILFLTSPCLFCAYQLCFLIPSPFPLLSPFPFPGDNPPNDLHIYIFKFLLEVNLFKKLNNLSCKHPYLLDIADCILIFFLKNLLLHSLCVSCTCVQIKRFDNIQSMILARPLCKWCPKLALGKVEYPIVYCYDVSCH